MALLLNAGDTVLRSYSYTQPSPLHPSQPSECGERTGNLWDFGQWLTDRGATYTKNGDSYTFGSQQAMYSTPFYFSQTDIIISISGLIEAVTAANPRVHLLKADGTRAKTDALTTANSKYENVSCAGLIFDWSTPGNIKVSLPMLNTGSTALPYEPYGYKIPISSANTTTSVYLGEVQSTRQIYKLVLTGQEDFSNPYGTSLFSLLITPLGKIRYNAYCTHYNYNPVQSGLNANTENGEFALQWQSTQTLLAFKDTSYTSPTDFKSYLQAQYANCTPVTIWYVLATPTTGIVNEPIRKISDYADTVSGISIPTITGADSFDVLTTLKPSEVNLTYTGWHDATVEEWDGSQWQ